MALAAIVFLGIGAIAAPWAAALLREHRLKLAVPALDPDVRRHIARDSDRAWFSYCRSVGIEVVVAVLPELLSALHTREFQEFERRRGPALGAYLRVGQALSEIHRTNGLERGVRNDLALPSRADFERRKWERRFIEVPSDSSLTPEARTQELDRITRWFLAIGDSGRALHSAINAASCELDRGRGDLYGSRLRAALGLARSLQEHEWTCQLLGELGVVHQNAGNVDSMRLCFDEGIELARRHEFVGQAARLLKFYATFYADGGRLAVAVDRLAEAVRLADSAGGAAAQARLRIEYARLLADLGCWDLVERSLRRLPPLLRKLSARGQTVFRLRYDFDSELLRARLAFATGRGEEGVRRMRQLSASVPPSARRVGLADLLEEWSLGLERLKRLPEALEICARGLAHCDTTFVPGHIPVFLLRAARIEASRGRLQVASALLDSVRGYPLSAGSASLLNLEADVLEARLLFLRGRKQLAKRQIEQVFRKFQARWRDADGGALGNLEPVGANALRDAIHEIEQFTPEQGYRFETEWRLLTMRSGPQPSPGASLGSIARPRMPRRSGTHLLYRFAGDMLIRWTADSSRVVMDTIPISAERCLAEVRASVESIQSEPAAAGRFLGPESFVLLRGLSELLLPRALAVAKDRPLRLEVTPDGPLSALPFEALPFPPTDGALPLALTADIAYVRGGGAPRPGANGEVVIVSNPLVPNDLAMRYGWPAPLRESDAEARDALRRWPHAATLSGSEATKDAIRERLPRASIIYFAAHHVRDPDAPILGFVPLWAPPGAPPDAALLESADIRGLDLSACRLAVLASCGSGAPYRSAVRPGPSLGDAFLDSGAAAVVRSFWEVGDVEARDFMRVLLSHWRPDQPDAVSLGRARREVMRAPHGASPRVWAVWSVLASSPR